MGDKCLDLDCLRGLWISRRYLFLAQNDILTLFVLDSLDDVFPIDLFTGFFIDTLITHRIHTALVQPIKIKPFFRRCGMKRHGYMHQPEADSAFP